MQKQFSYLEESRVLLEPQRGQEGNNIKYY